MSVVANYIRVVIVGQIDDFERLTIGKALAAFDSAEAESQAVAEQRYRNLGSVPGEADLADLAERANEDALEHFIAMRSIAQGLRNLIAAGSYHLFEQQQAAMTILFARHGLTSPAYTALQAYPKIVEARLVANVVKHGEGRSAVELRKIRPDLFRAPTLKGLVPWRVGRQPAVEQPIAGNSLYASDQDIRDYCAAVRGIWEEVESKL